jgi:hypothetical protein
MMDFIQHSSIQDLEAIGAAGATNRLLAEDDEPAAWPQPPYHRFDGGLLRIYTDLSVPRPAVEESPGGTEEAPAAPVPDREATATTALRLADQVPRSAVPGSLASLWANLFQAQLQGLSVPQITGEPQSPSPWARTPPARPLHIPSPLPTSTS